MALPAPETAHRRAAQIHSDEKAKGILCPMDEGRKRVIGIIAGIIMARNLDRADDLFGGPQGSPRTDKMIAAAVQWADRILRKIDSVFG